jgi:uncharacterized protein YPO0396
MENPAQKGGLTPETSDMNDFYDRKPEAKGEVTPETGDVKDIRDTEKLARGDLTPRLRRFKGFMNNTSFIYMAKCLGNLTDQEAQTLFNRLKDRKKLALDPDGLWRWV